MRGGRAEKGIMMGKKYLAEVLNNELFTIYDEPRRYLGLRMLALLGSVQSLMRWPITSSPSWERSLWTIRTRWGANSWWSAARTSRGAFSLGR